MIDNLLYISDSDAYSNTVRLYYRDSSGVLQIDETSWNRKTLPSFLPLSWDYYFSNNCKLDLDNWRVCYYDIECDDSDPSFNLSKKTILSICFIDDRGKRLVLDDDNEMVLLRKAERIFDAYDAMIGYNSDHFDFPLLIERGNRYGIDFWQYNWKSGDLYTIFKKFNNINIVLSSASLSSWGLDSLGKYFLGTGKVEFERKGSGDILKLYRTNKSKLIEYNMHDVEITKGLAEKFDVINTLKVMSSLSKCPPNLIFYTMNFVTEFVILDFILKEPKILQKELFEILRKNYSKSGEDYVGALNFIKSPGYYKDICVYDFHSLYPSIIRTMNLSFETVDKLPANFDITDKAIQIKLCEMPKGVVPKIIDRLQTERDNYKKTGEKTKEVSIKLIMNSIYGYFGSKTSKFKNVAIARSITGLGRHILTKISENENSIYGDTDSTFFKVNESSVESTRDELNRFVYSMFSDLPNIDSHYCLELAVDKYFKKLILIEKKKYIGLKSDGKLYGKGIELVKSDFTPVGKRVMQSLVDNLLYSDYSIDDAISMLIDEKNKILTGKYPVEDFLMTQSVSKDPSEYKSIPIHVQVAIDRTKRGNTAYFGQKISYVITGRKNGRIVGVDSENLEGVVPYYEYYWKNKISKSLERILRVVYDGNDKLDYLLFNMKDVKTAGIQNSLSSHIL